MPPKQSPPPRKRPATRAAHATSPTARKSSTRPTKRVPVKNNAAEKRAAHRRQVKRPPQKARVALVHRRTQSNDKVLASKPRERARERSRINPRIAERKNEVARQAGHRRILVATSLLIVPAIIASAFVVLHSSLFAISGVKVQGAVETSPSQIIDAAGLTNRPALINVNPIAVATKIESLPWIASATVVRHWPKSVTIAVTERVPVAEANVARHSWELFDRDGRALGYRTTSTSGLVRIQKLATMTRPSVVATGAIGNELAVADALPVGLSPQIREVGYLAKDGVIVDLSAGPIAIFGGTDALADKVVALNTLLSNHVSLAGVTSVDLRVPSSPVLSMTSLKGLVAKG